MAGRVPLPGLRARQGLGAGPGTADPPVRGLRRQVSVTAGTVLHGSHLGLRTWFLAAWLMATHKNGISARQLWLQLGLGSYKSAWLLARKLRRAMVDPEREPLAGLVEVDETWSPFASTMSPPGPDDRTRASCSSPARSRSRARGRAGSGSR